MRPLAGLLAVEVGDQLAAQYCGLILASLGARVVRVDEPTETATQDEADSMPGSKTVEGSFRRLHLAVGKESVTVRYSSVDGEVLLRQLLGKADILVEGLGPAQAKAVGLDYETVHAENPRLLVASLSWFGHEGPYADYRATDLTCSALSGYVYLNGHAGQPPLNLPKPLGQYIAGLNAAIGICALLNCENRADGRLDVSVQESLEIQLAGAPTDAVRTGNVSHRAGNRMAARNGGRTYTGILPCADGYVVVAVVGEADVLRLTKLGLDVDSLPPDARTRPGAYPDEIDRLLAPWLAGRERDSISYETQAVGLHWAEVLSPAEAATTPQAVARQTLGYYTHPLFGSLPFVQLPVRSGPDGPAFHLLGQDNESILTGDLGLSRQEVSALASDGVV
jgi:crotonobetainyl-CoA:carnitine CoA-transferase CaiB-like acyl-CoA transferase